jgi:L-fucose mutarotase/ribose pyranase (RbsD/FucU family)
MDRLKELLPTLGHRNWVLIADAAYPLQVAPGIEVVSVDMNHEQAVEQAVRLLSSAPHVSPKAAIDLELVKLAEGNDWAKQILGLMRGALNGTPTRTVLHENLISEVSEAAKEFKVLVLKTNCARPYTTLFLTLECGYWMSADEQKLRDSMERKR